MRTLHTSFRVGDLDRSVDFYRKLGFEKIGQVGIREESILVMMNLPGDGDVAMLELIYNHGVDSYELGDGFSHLAMSVDDGARPGWLQDRAGAVPGGTRRGRHARGLRAGLSRQESCVQSSAPLVPSDW